MSKQQDLFVVASPWGDGSWVVLDNPDPHQGPFFADCEDQANAPDADAEVEKARIRAETIVQMDRTICTLRAAFVAGFTDEYVRALEESVATYDGYLEKLRELESVDV